MKKGISKEIRVAIPDETKELITTLQDLYKELGMGYVSTPKVLIQLADSYLSLEIQKAKNRLNTAEQ